MVSYIRKYSVSGPMSIQCTPLISIGDDGFTLKSLQLHQFLCDEPYKMTDWTLCYKTEGNWLELINPNLTCTHYYGKATNWKPNRKTEKKKKKTSINDKHPKSWVLTHKN